MKVVAQASNHKELTVGGRTYRAKDGIFNIPERAARKAIKLQAGQAASLSGTTRRGIGYYCQSCNFASFFRTCSRCKGTCNPD